MKNTIFLMEKNELINFVNETLIKEYGIPERAKNKPDPLDLLIATILSQNTNDNNSYKAYLNLKSKINSFKDIIDMPIEELETLIKTAGLTKQKAKTIKKFMLFLSEKYNKFDLNFINKFTDDEVIDFLVQNEGIGVKTASCVLMFSLYRDICPVDTHVHRLVNRVGIVNTKTPDKSFYILNIDFPKGIAHSFHTNLIKHGRKICRPKNPFCGDCVLKDICKFELKNSLKKTQNDEERILLLDKI